MFFPLILFLIAFGYVSMCSCYVVKKFSWKKNVIFSCKNMFFHEKNLIFQPLMALGVVVLKVVGQGNYWCSICWSKKMTRSFCWIFSKKSLQVSDTEGIRLFSATSVSFRKVFVSRVIVYGLDFFFFCVVFVFRWRFEWSCGGTFSLPIQRRRRNAWMDQKGSNGMLLRLG